MKQVVSVSLGSAKRDKIVETEILGEKFRISRMGTNGDIKKYADKIRELDGKIDAVCLGGIDLYVYSENKRYTLQDACNLAMVAKKTPVVDGSGLKNTLERRTVEELYSKKIVDFENEKTMVVCGADRFGMAQAIGKIAKSVVYGDLMFVLQIPIPIRNYKSLAFAVDLLMPVVSKLPFHWLYPTGEKQEIIKPRYGKYFEWADVIAGDWHIIRRNLPTAESGIMKGKTIITNTITPADIELLRERQLKSLITTTPEFEGRHFGTNVLEGVLITLLGKTPDEVTPEDYNRILDQLKYSPTVVNL